MFSAAPPSPLPPTITTTTSDKSRISASTILYSSTQTSPVTSTTTAKSTAQTSLPIVAGAAAGKASYYNGPTII